MNCPDVQRLLHPYSDGELDLVRHLQVEGHLAECAACAEQEKNLRSLRAAVASPSLYYRAPAALRTRLQLASPPVRRRALSSVRMAGIAASILLIVGASTMAGVLLSRAGPSAEERVAEWVVAGHVRSLQARHLTDVISSDQHTVKPWFRGKLDFSPQVPDLSAEEYTLTGGRLDYLVDRPVAAIVYHRRLHAINLFVRAAADDEERPTRALTRQGYHLRYWQRSGMTYWAISDLNDQELDEFVRLYQARSAALHP
jgi:anti-sigma factor RsiW